MDFATTDAYGDHCKEEVKSTQNKETYGSVPGQQETIPGHDRYLPCFFQELVQFPNVDPITKSIPLTEFLAALKGIVQFVDLLGIVFTPVSSDLKRDMGKITTKFMDCPDEYKYLNDVMVNEKATINDGKLRIGCDAICSLNRNLQYLSLVLTFLVQDYEERKKMKADGGQECSEDISKHFSQAYELTLKKHHGWFLQKIFNLCLRSVPSRSDLVAMLLKPPASSEAIPGSAVATKLLILTSAAINLAALKLASLKRPREVAVEADEDALFEHIANYLINLKTVNDTIDQLFLDYDIKI